jgi:hypothetical protein
MFGHIMATGKTMDPCPGQKGPNPGKGLPGYYPVLGTVHKMNGCLDVGQKVGIAPGPGKKGKPLNELVNMHLFKGDTGITRHAAIGIKRREHTGSFPVKTLLHVADDAFGQTCGKIQKRGNKHHPGTPVNDICPPFENHVRPGGPGHKGLVFIQSQQDFPQFLFSMGRKGHMKTG